MKRAGRFMMIAAVIVLLLSVLGSVAYAAAHTHHDCTGDGCSVCAVLVQCDQRLRSAVTNGSAALLLLACSMAAAFLTSVEIREVPCETLVSLKVELLN